MKKLIYVLVVIASIFIVGLYIGGISLFIWAISTSEQNVQETLLVNTKSPNEKYILEVYRVSSGGATVDFSVKAYLIIDEERKLIYNAYHESDAEVVWIDNNIVSINGKKLDLSVGEKYDWRKDYK